VARIQLERTIQPASQSGRQRLRVAAGVDRRSRRENVADPCRILVVPQPATENQRKGGDPDLCDVGEMIEAWQTGDARQGDAQLGPVAFPRKKQLLERRSKYVFDDGQPSVGRDHEPFGTERPMRGIARSFVKDGNGRDELTDEAEGHVDVDRQPSLVGGIEQRGKPNAWRLVRCDGQSLIEFARTPDGTDPPVVRVSESSEAIESLTEGKFERRRSSQLASQAEGLDDSSRRILANSPLAEPIAKRHHRRRDARNMPARGV
jgi:hypothetical protein